MSNETTDPRYPFGLTRVIGGVEYPITTSARGLGWQIDPAFILRFVQGKIAEADQQGWPVTESLGVQFADLANIGKALTVLIAERDDLRAALAAPANGDGDGGAQS
jgi:hypothetical protein